MRDKKGHTTTDPVAVCVVLSNRTISPKFRKFLWFKISLLESNTNRVEIVDKVPDIGDVILKTMAIP